MGKPVPRQHPAVVLRSHFVLVRGLMAAAMVAVVALAVAVVILATAANEVAGAPSAAPLPQHQLDSPTDTRRYDGGPEEGTRGRASRTD
jgi:hypothetical protein